MIQLWDGYSITADTYQYILGQLKQRKTGENEMQNTTYHKTIGQALTAFHGIKLRECIPDDVQTLLGAITASKQIEERIRQLVQDVNFDDLKKRDERKDDKG